MPKQPKIPLRERGELAEGLQLAVDELELKWAQLKGATKLAKEQLDQARFKLRLVCLGIPEEPEEPEAPLYEPKLVGVRAEFVDEETGEVTRIS